MRVACLPLRAQRPRRALRRASQSKPAVAMAFASWWYKTVNRSGRSWAGTGRECVCFAFPGVRMSIVWVLAGKGRGPGATSSQDLGRGRDSPYGGMHQRARECEEARLAHKLNGTGIVAEGIPPLEADSWMNSARKNIDLVFLTCKQSSKTFRGNDLGHAFSNTKEERQLEWGLRRKPKTPRSRTN